MKKALLLLWILGSAMTALAAGIPGDREAWLRLLEMPKLQISFDANWSSESGFFLSNDEPDPAVEIPKLKARLRQAPSDAAVFMEMWRVYARVGDARGKSNALASALPLYRRQLESQPESVEVLVGYGTALMWDGRLEEAEAVLRRAGRTAPKDWRAWSALGGLQSRKALRTLEFSPGGARETEPREDSLQRAARRGCPARDLESARLSAAEAAESVDRAVLLAPEEPEVFQARALVSAAGNRVAFLHSVANGADPDPIQFHAGFLGTNVLADLWRIVELTPRNVRNVGLAVLLQAMFAKLPQPGRDPSAESDLLGRMPAADRRRCVAGLERLAEIGQKAPPAEAALALEIRGLILFIVVEDERGVEADLRRAIELAPERQGAWDALIGLFHLSNRFGQARSMAEKRLQAHDTARNRIIAAKTCEKLGLLPQARAHVEAALKLEPDGYLPNQAALVLVLKSSRDADAARLMIPYFQKLRDAPKDDWPRSQHIESNLAAGIGWALCGEPTAARPCFELVKKFDPENTTAIQALAMLAGR